MKNNENLPLSKNMRREEIKDYFLTLSSWETYCGKTFEIVIRKKKNNEFCLLPGWVNYELCNSAFEAIKVLLGNGIGIKAVKEIMHPRL